MHDAALYWVMLPAARDLVDETGEAVGELPTFGRHACYNVYRTKDGRHLALGALETKFWRAFCGGHRPAGSRRPARDDADDQAALIEEMRGVFATRTRDEWLAFFGGHDVCLTPVNQPAEALARSAHRARAARTVMRSAGPSRRSARRWLQNPAPARSPRPRVWPGHRRPCLGGPRGDCVLRCKISGYGSRLDLPSAARASTTCGTSTSTCRATGWSSSPACPGSGKSSLAFDTIYAEGQRRYVESLSAYARQFLEQMEKPDVDLIDGLSPAISIEQKTTGVQSAIDGRHGHRDLRLPAPALRQHRRAALSRTATARSRRSRSSGSSTW